MFDDNKNITDYTKNGGYEAFILIFNRKQFLYEVIDLQTIMIIKNRCK